MREPVSSTQSRTAQPGEHAALRRLVLTLGQGLKGNAAGYTGSGGDEWVRFRSLALRRGEAFFGDSRLLVQNFIAPRATASAAAAKNLNLPLDRSLTVHFRSRTDLRLRLLSYNIHRAIGLDRRFRPERIVRVLAHYDADIAMLQEVDEGAPRSRGLHLARELAEAAGYEHFAFGHNVTLRKGRYGNATLSRFPILRERNIDLTIGQKKRRGAQHTTIQLGLDRRISEIDLFNLHLGLSAQERNKQVLKLIRSPELRQLPRRQPTIVGGDFNDWRSLLPDALAATHRFREASRIGSGPLKTFPSFAPQGSLDRIYTRGPIQVERAFRCRLQVSKIASDHLPIVLDLKVHSS